MATQAMKIAIVKLSALGDIIHAMIVLQYIKKAFPHSIIDWFVEARFVGILEHNPHINAIHTLSLKHNKLKLFDEYKKLKGIAKEENYDCVIDLQGLIKSAIVSRILGKNCIGFDKNSLRESLAALFYHRSFAIDYGENIILRNLKLVSKALSFEMPSSLEEKEAFLFTPSKNDIKLTLLIIVGSSWKSKIYPKEHFATIINALNVLTYLSWGNEQEKDTAHYIASHTKAIVLPPLTLNELKEIIANTTLVIGGDSGPTHMAWALGRPSITIFGPTPSWRNTIVTLINKTIDCNNLINPKKINKNDTCIEMIEPHIIIELAKKSLAYHDELRQ
jgi:heptosyltransferase-1